LLALSSLNLKSPDTHHTHTLQEQSYIYENVPLLLSQADVCKPCLIRKGKRASSSSIHACAIDAIGPSSLLDLNKTHPSHPSLYQRTQREPVMPWWPCSSSPPRPPLHTQDDAAALLSPASQENGTNRSSSSSAGPQKRPRRIRGWRRSTPDTAAAATAAAPTPSSPPSSFSGAAPFKAAAAAAAGEQQPPPSRPPVSRHEMARLLRLALDMKEVRFPSFLFSIFLILLQIG